MDNLNDMIMEWKEMEMEEGIPVVNYTIKRIHYIPKFLEIFRYEDLDEFYAYIQLTENIRLKIIDKDLHKEYLITTDKEKESFHKYLYRIDKVKKEAVCIKISYALLSITEYLYNNNMLYEPGIILLLNGICETILELIEK